MRKSVPHAFSLVELLVVIAIVAVLLAMLLPSLSKARELARDTLCMSHARSNAQSVLLYTLDYKNAAPPHVSRPTLTDPYTQDNKSPDEIWVEITQRGKNRAGLTFPDYNDGRTFYCPYDTTHYYTKNGGGAAGAKGLKYYGWTGWNGVYPASYMFPAVKLDYTTNTSYGGDWTGNAATGYWTTTNYWNQASQWRTAMAERTVEENNRISNPMLWDRNGLHGYRLSNIAYWDGAVLKYPYAASAYAITHSTYGARGMQHPSNLIWFRAFRINGTPPS